MERTTTTIPQADIDRQLSFCREIAQINAARPQPPLAFVDTYGCQQNEADSERIRGYLRQMGPYLSARSLLREITQYRENR